jgi:hypothetical protein
MQRHGHRWGHGRIRLVLVGLFVVTGGVFALASPRMANTLWPGAVRAATLARVRPASTPGGRAKREMTTELPWRGG